MKSTFDTTENIVPFPGNQGAVNPSDLNAVDGFELNNQVTKPHLSHGLSPLKSLKVEYWHEGEQPQEKKTDVIVVRRNHAKRADQFGMLLISLSLIVVLLIGLTLFLNEKKYLFSTAKAVESSSAVVDFYQGNHVFSSKLAEEKEAKQHPGYTVHGLTTVNDDLEVPLNDQMNSMSEKMKKMRILQREDEPAPPTADTGPKGGLPILKPTKDSNFQSPLEFNNALPKPLQSTQ